MTFFGCIADVRDIYTVQHVIQKKSDYYKAMSITEIFE